MENILTLGLTPEETAQLKTEFDAMLSELKRMRVEIERDHKEIKASRARTALVEQDIQRMLANRRRERDAEITL